MTACSSKIFTEKKKGFGDGQETGSQVSGDPRDRSMTNAAFSVTVTQPLIHFAASFSIFGNFDWILPANMWIRLEIRRGWRISGRFRVSMAFQARSQLMPGSWLEKLEGGGSAQTEKGMWSVEQKRADRILGLDFLGHWKRRFIDGFRWLSMVQPFLFTHFPPV